MPLEILSKRTNEEWHCHLCPICKKYRREPNTVCGMTGQDHKFACLLCLQDYRLRLGTDILIDVYLDSMQAKSLNNIAPDAHSQELDQRDAFRRAVHAAEAEQHPKKKPLVELSPEDQFKAAKEARDKLIDEASVLTYDETVSEIARLKKEEEI